MAEIDRSSAGRRPGREGFPRYAARCLVIRPKTGGLVPFRLNRVQRHIHARIEAQRKAGGRVRALILKARQPGCSTYVAGRFYWQATRREGVRVFILTHRQDATDNIFGIVNRFHARLPDEARPQTAAANARALHFKALDSGYRVGTAGAAEVGRSETIELPALTGLLYLVLRIRRESEDRSRSIREQCDGSIAQVRADLAAYKLEVAKSYASIDYLKDVDRRLSRKLEQIEDKLDALLTGRGLAQ